MTNWSTVADDGFELSFGYPDEQAVRRRRRAARRRRRRLRNRRPGRHPVGQRRRVRGRQPPGLGRPRPGVPGRWSTRSSACATSSPTAAAPASCSAAWADPRSPPRSSARPTASSSPSSTPPTPTTYAAPWRPARAHHRGRLQQVRRDRRDRQPEARLRAGVPRRRPRAGGAHHRRHRPGLPARRGGRRGRLPRLPRQPRRGRPLLGADRVRAGAERARRCRHRAAARRGGRRSSRTSSATTPTTPGCGSGRCSAWPTRPGSTRWCWATTDSGIPGFGDWAEQLIAESTGKDDKGILPVVVPSLDAPNFDPSTPDEVLVTIGAGVAHGRPARVGLGRPRSTRRWVPSCCCGSTPPWWPGGSSGSTPSTSPTWRAPSRPPATCWRAGRARPTPAFADGAGRGARHRGPALRREDRRRRRAGAAGPARRRARLPRGDGLPRPRR